MIAKKITFLGLFVLALGCKEPIYLPPVVFTAPVTFNEPTSALSGGSITSEGGAPVTERGVCWGVTKTPTISNDKTIDGGGGGAFQSTAIGLVSGTVYYLRAYATNLGGTAYGEELSFSLPNVPSIGTSRITEITTSTAICDVSLINDGGNTITSKGVCWSINPNPTISDNKTVTQTNRAGITGLSLRTTYYARAYATNSSGVGYSEQLKFTTIAPPILGPTVVTSVRSDEDFFTFRAQILDNGGSEIKSVSLFSRAGNDPTEREVKGLLGNGFVAVNRYGISPKNVPNYFRFGALNDAGYGYSEEVSAIDWMNFPDANLVDIDGNTYKTVRISFDVWMAENLKTTRLNDGSPIELITDGNTWGSLSTPAFCFYDNDEANKPTYGALYNWHVVNTTKLCPIGWHVPSWSEFSRLGFPILFCPNGGDVNNCPYLEPGNISGFSGLTGGLRRSSLDAFISGAFEDKGIGGFWWSSTPYAETKANQLYLFPGKSYHYRGYDYDRSAGLSIRCKKN